MKKVYPLLILISLLTACAVPPAEKIAGTYTGQYTNNAAVLGAGTAVITATGKNSCTITLSHPSFPTVTVQDVAVTEGDNSIALYKVDFINILAGGVTGNQLDASYTSIGGVITFIGSK